MIGIAATVARDMSERNAHKLLAWVGAIIGLGVPLGFLIGWDIDRRLERFVIIPVR